MELPRPQRRRHSIVLTSLVDVMFVLLFFFMLASSAVERRGVSIGLPAPASADVPLDRRRLTLAAGGAWTLDGVALMPDELEPRLRASQARRVEVIVGGGVTVQALTDALGTIRRLGLTLQLAKATDA